MKLPDIEALKRLRSRLNKTRGPDDALDKEIADAFGIDGLRPTHNLSDGVRLMREAIPDWDGFTLHGYPDRTYEGGDSFYPESYDTELSGPTPEHKVVGEDTESAYPEISILAATLTYLTNLPALDKAAAAARAHRAAREIERQREAKQDVAEAEETPPPAPPKEYPKTYEGYVESWADWLVKMRDFVPDDMAMAQVNDDGVTAARVMDHYDTCIRIMKGQAKAISIVQEMMEAEVAKNPSPRMKALKAAIEAVYEA